MRNTNLAEMIAAPSVELGLLAKALSESAGHAPSKRQPKSKPYVTQQRLEQPQDVREWNAAVQAKRDAVKRRGGVKT